MKLVNLNEFSLGLAGTKVTPNAINFRPPSWPPPRDWPVSLDANGVVISRWCDAIWDLTPIAGTLFSLNFGDGEQCQADRLDKVNADLLRLAMTWLMWGPRPMRSTGALQQKFTIIRAAFALCSQQGIDASSMMRFPQVLELLPKRIAPSRYDMTVATLHRLYDARDVLGFTLLDAIGLKRLASAAPDHEGVQTPYIPPRIWLYQVSRLQQCLLEFMAHAEKVEACFKFCLDCYAHNFGSLANALAIGKDGNRSPFDKDCRSLPGCKYRGEFSETAKSYGLGALLEQWSVGAGFRGFGGYLSMVTVAGLAYIANFTLQRKEEVASLRTSCLLWEIDPQLGRVPIICGVTTKTDPDSDARWIASPNVEIAVRALSIIARLRMLCDRENSLVAPSADDQADPYLLSAPNEPWSGGGHPKPYDVRTGLPSLTELIRTYPLLFDEEQLRISSADLKIARQLTPNLPEDLFSVGKPWPLAWHQYRRTTAVNMFASGRISDSSMQQQMKHCSRLMPIYYGRGHGRLRLNEKVEATVVKAMYSAMAEKLADVVSDRFVSPGMAARKPGGVINLLGTTDTKKLAKWAKAGKVTFREHRLGGCLKAGVCPYGGVESVVRCAGGNGTKPCADVVFDRDKEPQVRADLRRVVAEMDRYPAGTPRHTALTAERGAMESYLNVISEI